MNTFKTLSLKHTHIDILNIKYAFILLPVYEYSFLSTEMEYGYEEEEGSDVDRELRPIARRTGKHIAAGEERPRINSSQQTTPTEGK